MEKSHTTNWRRLSLLVFIALLSWPTFILVIALLSQRGFSQPTCILLSAPLAIVGFVSAIFAPVELRPFRAWRMLAGLVFFMCYGAALVRVLIR
jgi:hypothetical protein